MKLFSIKSINLFLFISDMKYLYFKFLCINEMCKTKISSAIMSWFLVVSFSTKIQIENKQVLVQAHAW